MAIKIVAKTAKGRIRNMSAKPSGLSKKEFAVAFGARPMALAAGRDSNPLALFQLRHQVMERLRSTGGRPALLDVARKVKIPVTDSDWHDVETIARKVNTGKFKPSAAQVASVILHMALQSFSEAEIRERIESTPE